MEEKMIYLALNIMAFLLLPFYIQNKSIKNNAKQYIKSHTGYVVITICLILYILIVLFINKSIDNVITSLCIALMPSSVPYLAYDLYKSAVNVKEKEGITGLLMILTKWSAVKNDAVYCLQKANQAQLGKPIGGYINDACIRLEKGMSVPEALCVCEENALSGELRYVIMNIRYAYEKGGSLYSIFKNMENQFFKIDEENFKRKINTSQDKYAVYISIGLVMATFYILILNNGNFKDYYLNTNSGMLLLGLFALLFFIGIIIMIKVVRR